MTKEWVVLVSARDKEGNPALDAQALRNLLPDGEYRIKCAAGIPEYSHYQLLCNSPQHVLAISTDEGKPDRAANSVGHCCYSSEEDQNNESAILLSNSGAACYDAH